MPLEPVTTAALISAGGQLAGGAIAGSGAGRQQNANDRNAIRDYNLQRKFAQNSIRWRVEDAKRAGLHPLYALQGAGATYTPSAAVTDFGAYKAQLGQGIARAANAVASMQDRELAQAQIELIKAQTGTEIAQQQALASEGARLRQPGQPAPVLVSDGISPSKFLSVSGMENFFNSSAVEAPVVKSRDSDYPFSTPMSTPGFMPVETGGSVVLMPEGANPSEAFESVGESALAMGAMLNANQQRYGQWEGLRRVWDAMTPNLGATDLTSRGIEVFVNRVKAAMRPSYRQGEFGTSGYLKLPASLRRFIAEHERRRARR